MKKEKLGTITLEEEAVSRTHAQRLLAKAKMRERETAHLYEWVGFSNRTFKRVPKANG